MFFDNDQNKRSKRNSQLGERIIKQMLMFINMLTRLLSVLRPGIRKFMFSECIPQFENTIFPTLQDDADFQTKELRFNFSRKGNFSCRLSRKTSFSLISNGTPSNIMLLSEILDQTHTRHRPVLALE